MTDKSSVDLIKQDANLKSRALSVTALHANARKSNYAPASELAFAESFFKRSHLYVP